MAIGQSALVAQWDHRTGTLSFHISQCNSVTLTPIYRYAGTQSSIIWTWFVFGNRETWYHFGSSQVASTSHSVSPVRHGCWCASARSVTGTCVTLFLIQVMRQNCRRGHTIIHPIDNCLPMPLLLTWLTAWMNNRIDSNTWDEITYPFRTFNAQPLKVENE